MPNDLCYINTSVCLQRKMKRKGQKGIGKKWFDWIGSLGSKANVLQLKNKKQSKAFKP